MQLVVRTASRIECAARGFTLVEVAIVLVIVGLLIQVVVTGQEMIHNARVHDIVAQQAAAEAAVLAFQDRFRALPGDYAFADTNIKCGASTCLNGNGNGRIEAGTGGAIHEEILAWQHMNAAGFVAGNYQMIGAAVSVPTPDNTPTSAYGGYLAVITDAVWGTSGNTILRNNVKTGNLVPAEIVAEVDRKTDDGLPGSGRFHFSTYAATGAAPAVGGTVVNGCTDADTPTAAWIARNGSDNCGAATLMR